MDHHGAAAAGAPFIGRDVPRPEDARLVTGGGRYTDDVRPANLAHGVFLRSGNAHGHIAGLDTAPAAAMPGVRAIVTAADLAAAGIGPIPCALPLKSHDGTPLIVPARPALAQGKVRHVGEAVALIVADTVAQARDAADAVELEIEALPAVTDIVQAMKPDAPQLHAEVPGNVCVDWRHGDRAAVDQAFAGAAHVTRLRLVNNRVVAASLEPRGAIAEFDAASDRLTLRLGCQGVFGLRNTLADAILKIPPEKLRVVAGDIGGSFGMKAPVYPEYVALLHAAKALGRPVKWIDERMESFVSDYHGRDAVVEGALALDADGRFLAVRFTGLGSCGAHVAGFGAMIPTINILKNGVGLYATPLVALAVKVVVTNTTPVSAYRGAGRPEANYYMERLVEQAARETGRDPVALRRLNMIPRAAMPYRAASGLTYDSGDFEAVLDAALARADWDGFEARRRASAAAGRLRGRGLGCYLEVTAPQGKEMGGLHFGADGRVTIITGTLDYGQGHRAAFAQVLADKLGLALDQIDLKQGDSDALLAGGGTGGSRSIMASGDAILAAGDQVIDKGRRLAAHYLEAAEGDIEFAAGQFRVAGTDRALGLAELAARVRADAGRPADLPDGLDSALVKDTPPSAYPNGCHIAEVEIDPETGAVRLDRYTMVDDFGTLINPMLVEGQVHGGVAQGIGQALTEHLAYDADGNLITGSFLDYGMPRADQVPGFDFLSHPVPARTNPLGAKGCGEGGTTGALPAVMNAVVDALRELGLDHIDMPATPARVWRAIRDARRRGGQPT